MLRHITALGAVPIAAAHAAGQQQVQPDHCFDTPAPIHIYNMIGHTPPRSRHKIASSPFLPKNFLPFAAPAFFDVLMLLKLVSIELD